MRKDRKSVCGQAAAKYAVPRGVRARLRGDVIFGNLVILPVLTVSQLS